MVKKKRSRLSIIKSGKARRSSVKNKRSYDKAYLELRNEVLARDLWTCQLCGATKVKLEVHHITLYSSSVLLRKNKRNLISLCRDCHKKVRNKEDRYKTIFRAKVARNILRYKKDKKTKEQHIEELKASMDASSYEDLIYKAPDTSKKSVKKYEEDYLRKTWRGMKGRTSNKKNKSYPRYGGRGIKVYKPWFDDFSKFRKYVEENLGDRPEGYSLDREDNDGNYEPGNIRWESPAVQKQNNSQTVLTEDRVLVIFILHHKYGWRPCDIMYKMKLTSNSIVTEVTNFNSWKNVTFPYRAIVKKASILKKIEAYEDENKGDDQLKS